jgi:hypothetical protein
MTLQDFILLIRERDSQGTLIGKDEFGLDGHVRQDILDLFSEHAEQLKREFFERAYKELPQNEFSYIGILNVYPFTDEADRERLQKLVFDIIERMEHTRDADAIAKLGGGLWVLLDHMLHDWVISDHDELMARLRRFKNLLPQIDPADGCSLQQKLFHFGVE